MTTFLVGVTQKRRTREGELLDDGIEQLHGFLIVEAQGHDDAVAKAAKDQVGTYVVLTADLRYVQTVVNS